MATLTPNTFTNGMRLGPRLHRLRQADATVEDSFRIRAPSAVFAYELRRCDISASPQTFGDFDRNNTANAVREAFFQMFLRTCQNIVQAHFQSTVNAGEFPIEMFLEVVLRPEGEEVVDVVDREAKEARDLVADFIARHYGPARFNAAEISNQQGSLNGATTESIRFMKGYDHRRVFSYRFYVVCKESKCDFPSHLTEVLEMSIAHFQKFTGGEGVKSARFANAKGAGPGAGKSGSSGGGGAQSLGGSSGGLDSKRISAAPSMPYSRYVADTERWLLINSYLEYMGAVATYLRDETLLAESVQLMCADMTRGLKTPDNPASPCRVFSLITLFKSAVLNDLPIEALQKDVRQYITVVGESEGTFTFPLKKLVLRIPLAKMASASSISTMYMPEVQKATIEPHMDLQRSVGGGIERVMSQSQSLAENDDDDIDDKVPQSVDAERRAAPIVRGSHTNSSDDEAAMPLDRSQNAREDDDERSLSSLEEMSTITIDGEDGAVFNRAIARPVANSAARVRVDNDDDNEDDGHNRPVDGRSNVKVAYNRARERLDGGPPERPVPDAQSEHPLIAEGADTFAYLYRQYKITPERDLAPTYVPEINAAYLMNGDYGDAKQMELAKTLTTGTEEGGPNRTDYHIMRARVFHGACKIIASLEKEVPRTKARLRMQFAAMEEYRSKCCSSVSNISDPMKAMMVWMEGVKRVDKAAYRCILKFVEPTLSLFAHSKFRLAQGLDEFECIFTAHTEIMMALACAKTAYYYVFELRLNPLLYGPAGSSKSEVLQKLVDLFIKGTVEAVTSESTHAGDTEDNENDVVRVMHELPASMASKKASDDHVLESLKNHMTAGILTRNVLDIDPITHKRSKMRITSEKQIAFCAATNMDESMLDKAVKDRFILIHQVKKLRPDCTIAQKMAQRANMAIDVQRMREDFLFNLQLDQFLYANTEKCLMIGILTRPSIVCTPIILARYMEVLESRFGIKCDRRLTYKVITAARVHTIEAAITWLYQSPLSPCYGREFDMWHLLVLEPWLKDTEEIAMYAIDDLRAQFFDPDQEQFFHALREWVLPKHLEEKLRLTLQFGFRRHQSLGSSTLEAVNSRHQAFRVFKLPSGEKRTFHGHRETRTTTEKVDVAKGEAQRKITTMQETVNIAVQNLIGNNSVASAASKQVAPQQQQQQQMATAIGVKSVDFLDMCTHDEYVARTSMNTSVVKPLTKAEQVLSRFVNRNHDQSNAPSAEEMEEAYKAEYNYDYVSFSGTVNQFARRVASANAANKAFREIDAGELTTLLHSWTSRKVVSRRYVPNPYSSTPPVVLCEETDEETFAMLRIDTHNNAIYIHTSLLIGEVADPHEQALRECASLFTPKARFISALPHDPSTPHLLRVRDVKPLRRAHVVHSIQKMSREAMLMGLTRETACAHGIEEEGVHANYADAVEEDEDAMRAKPAIEFDGDRAPKVLGQSLDAYATFEHLRAIGMPCIDENTLFFNAAVNDRVARETPEHTIKTPLSYPHDNLASLFTYKKNEESFRAEVTDISIGDLQRKRGKFGRNMAIGENDKPVVGVAPLTAIGMRDKFMNMQATMERELIAGGLEDQAERASKRKKTIDGNRSTTDTLMAPPAPMKPCEKQNPTKRRPAAHRRAVQLEAVKQALAQEAEDSLPPPVPAAVLPAAPPPAAQVSPIVEEPASAAMSVDGSENDYIDHKMDRLVALVLNETEPLANDAESRMRAMVSTVRQVSAQSRLAAAAAADSATTSTLD